MSDEKWLTVEELAARYGIGVSTVKRKVKSREWPHGRPAGRVRFGPDHVKAIDALVDEPPINARQTVVPIRSRVRRTA